MGSGSINEKRKKLDQKTSVLVKVASSVLNALEGPAAARINFINNKIITRPPGKELRSSPSLRPGRPHDMSRNESHET